MEKGAGEKKLAGREVQSAWVEGQTEVATGMGTGKEVPWPAGETQQAETGKTQSQRWGRADVKCEVGRVLDVSASDGEVGGKAAVSLRTRYDILDPASAGARRVAGSRADPSSCPVSRHPPPGAATELSDTAGASHRGRARLGRARQWAPLNGILPTSPATNLGNKRWLSAASQPAVFCSAVVLFQAEGGKMDSCTQQQRRP